MEAKELRIGNWITYCGKDIQICGVSDDPSILFNIDGRVYPCTKFDELFPVNLTAEWLVRFGAEGPDNETYSIMIDDYTLSRIIYYNGKAIFSVRGEEIGSELNFVHELQNLYFVLSGNELSYE